MISDTHIMKNNFDISIIIVSFNTKNILINCIESIFQNMNGINFEIIVVDNNSTDGTKVFLNQISKRKNVRCIYLKENKGFGIANNTGMRISSGKYILLLNSDTEVVNDVIQKCMEWMGGHESYGVISPNLYNKDGSIQGTGGYFPNLLRVFSWMTIQDIPFVDLLIKPFHPMRSNSFYNGNEFYRKERDLDWVTGAFFMLRRETFNDVGFFDNDFFMYTEEVEYCFRIKEKGWKIKYLPISGVIHLGGASSTIGFSVLREFNGIKLLYKKHFPKWQYSVLRIFLKIGCLGRIFVFGLLKGKEAAKIYAKAFIET